MSCGRFFYGDSVYGYYSFYSFYSYYSFYSFYSYYSYYNKKGCAKSAQPFIYL